MTADLAPPAALQQFPMVRARDVRKRFGSKEVLKGIDLDVQRGEVTCILGPSGSGKSTFLRSINYLEEIDSGQLLVDGHPVGYKRLGNSLHELRERDICRNRAEIGMVFQNFQLFPHMTVLANIMEAPVQVKKEPRAEVRVRAQQLLERVGLADRGDSYPLELSGGQQQRVAIARAIVGRPQLLLADEPTGNLDSTMSEEIMGLLQSLNRERAVTVVMVTHDKAKADRSDRILRVFDGQLVH